MNNTNREKADKIFERFKQNFPIIASKVNRYYMDGRYTLALEFDDDHVELWDEFDQTFLPLPKNRKTMSPEQYRIEIGRRISKVMFRKSITQEKLSELTGIAQSQLSGYISGRVMPNFIALDKITRALRMSLEELRNIDLDNEIDRYW